MTVAIHSWMIPAALTVAIWVAAVLWPIRSHGGDYDFGPQLEATLHGIVGVFATLVVWLVYFAVMFWTS